MFATAQQASREFVAARRPAYQAGSAPEIQGGLGEPILQRKTCPCGGGCPACGLQLEGRNEASVSSLGEGYEREADEVADKVMARAEPVPISSIGAAATESIPAMNTRAAINEAGRSGSPLSSDLRTFFEPRFGRDLSHVRIHSDAAAANAARSIRARAYTYGSDIVIGAGEYAPGTVAGKRLLAHELVHVVQQTDKAPARGGSGANPRVQRKPLEASARSGDEGWAGLIEATVQELDKRESHYFTFAPKYGDADFNFLVDMLTLALEKGWWQQWALGLQQRQQSPFGNHLFQFYLILNDNNPKLAQKFAQLLGQRGIAIGPETGGFQSLAFLDPRTPAPLNPAIAKLPAERSVDAFTTATYDLTYKPSQPGWLSTTLRVSYADGTTIEISLWDISDNIDTAAVNAIRQSYVGQGGRVFPSRMSRNTTPRLWAEKRKALAAMYAENQDFGNFVSIGLAGVMANLPVGPVVGAAPVDVAPVGAPRGASSRSVPIEPGSPPIEIEPGAPLSEPAEPATPAPQPATPAKAEPVVPKPVETTPSVPKHVEPTPPVAKPPEPAQPVPKPASAAKSEPVTSAAPEPVSSAKNTPSTAKGIPQKALDTLKHVKQTGTAPAGQVGGRTFGNHEGHLPAGGTYKEYDVDPRIAGVARNAERIVVDVNSGRAWYTSDHYRTFTEIK
jgi:guanyl-specific ribonuclease Sa